MHKRAIVFFIIGLMPFASFCQKQGKQVFTLSELEKIKHSEKRPPDVVLKKSVTTLSDFSRQRILPPFVDVLRSQPYSPLSPSSTPHISYEDLFWWQIFPTTGLRLEKPFWPLSYPYLPHAFALWELAPSLGKGVSVCLVDTGVFGFTFSTNHHSWVKHPDIAVEGNFLSEPHNMLPYEPRSYNPFKNVEDFVLYHTQTHLQNAKKIRKLISSWIIEYKEHGTTTALDNYLMRHGNAELFENNLLFFRSKQKLLSAEGKRVKNALLLGDHGFSHFTLVKLDSGQKALVECIPTPSQSIKSKGLQSPMIDHATHTASIIGARLTVPHAIKDVSQNDIHTMLSADIGLCGLAPHCSLRVIKALPEGFDTITDIHHNIHALELAVDYEVDILNASLKLDDTLHSNNPLVKKLGALLEHIPYVCCAAGNEGTKKPGRIPYPARFKNVPFSVGSFGCSFNTQTKTYTCSLSSFSQHEKGCGPLFVAPGEEILGCSCAYAKQEPWYALKTGTSCATAYMSGIMALIVGEFRYDFSREQILKVCQASCFKLHDTAEWKEHVLYGVLDSRTALFTLHVLKQLKSFYSPEQFAKRFCSLVSVIHDELFALPNTYGKQCGITYSYKENFIDYFNAVQRFPLPPEFQKRMNVPLRSAIDTIVKQVHNNSFSSPE